MPRRIAFSAEDCQRMADLVDSLDITQRSLAKSSGVGQPWLSYLLRAKRLTNTDAVKLERVAGELAAVVLQKLDHGAFSAEQAHVALSFLARFANVATVAPTREDPPPGGPIPIDSIPYVQREDDDFLANLPLSGSSDVLVWGPPQSGKSTALALLQRRAYELGIETAWFDPQPSFEQSSVGEAAADSAAASALCELLQVKWSLSEPRFGAVDSVGKLSSWLVAELGRTPSKPRLLILDDLANIGRGAPARWISRFLRYVGHSRATQQLRISVAAGVTHRFGAKYSAQVAISSDHWWKRRLEVGWFRPDQVNAIVGSLRAYLPKGSDPNHIAAQIFELFQGQPFLSHAAIIDNQFLLDSSNWTRTKDDDAPADAVRAHTWYRRHRNAIQIAIYGAANATDADSTELLHEFRNLYELDPSSPAYDNVVASINVDHMTFLTKCGLLNKDKRPAIAMYRLIADDLLNPVP